MPRSNEITKLPGRALRCGSARLGVTRDIDYPAGILDDQDAALWIGLQVPEASRLGFQPTDNQGGEQLWLFATDGSWAFLGTDAATVEQYGPRKLWDEAERAYRQWEGVDKPARHRIGLTVDAEGRQQLWLDQPEHEIA